MQTLTSIPCARISRRSRRIWLRRFELKRDKKSAQKQELRADIQRRQDEEVEGARGVLSTIAGSIITVTGVVFSITIVVLQLTSMDKVLTSYGSADEAFSND